MVAAPAGLVIWAMANMTVNNTNLLTYCAQFLIHLVNCWEWTAIF